MSQVVGNARKAILTQDRRVRQELAVGLENTGIELEYQQNQAVRRWVHKPKFRRVLTVARLFMVVRVPASGRNAQQWRWVNYGTRGPYPITPRFALFLRFRTGYQPKTAPVAKVNAAGGQASGPWVTTQFVWHPGVEARKFTQKFAEDIRPIFRTEVEQAIRRALRRR